MFVPLGTRRNDGDLVDHLLECHGRIRDAIALAGRLAVTREVPEDEVRGAAARVRRYFTEALPLHVADEDLEVLPRLRGRDAEIDSALTTMHADHLDHERDVARIIRLCDELERAPSRHGELAPDLAAISAGLGERFAGHLELEERVIFPALRGLPAGDQAAISTAMRERREPTSR